MTTEIQRPLLKLNGDIIFTEKQLSALTKTSYFVYFHYLGYILYYVLYFLNHEFIRQNTFLITNNR